MKRTPLEYIKYAWKRPDLIIPFITSRFKSKKDLSVDFWVQNYKHLPLQFVEKKEKEFWKKYRYFDEISELIGLDNPGFKDKKILDVGCGYVGILNTLPQAKKYGIDIIINGLKRSGLPLRKGIKWIHGKVEKLPFKDNQFDIVCSTNGLDHYNNPVKAVSEIRRVLKNDGIFLVTINIFNEEIGYRDKQHPHSFIEKSILELLKDFEILFKKKSKTIAQVTRYINNNMTEAEGMRELILVMRSVKE